MNGRCRDGGVSEHYAYQSSRGYVYRRKAGGYMLPVFFCLSNSFIQFFDSVIFSPILFADAFR